MIYSFEAKAIDGKVIKGEVEAANEVEARVKLRAQQLIPTTLHVKVDGGDGGGLNLNFGGPGRVKPKELQVFTRQFSVLVGAGVPIVDSLDAMTGGGKTPVLNNALKSIVNDIEKGKRLADAMNAHENVFDRMYVSLVKAGEEGGVLDEVLQRLADYIERSVKLKGKVKGALMYPAVILIIASLVIAGILTFVVPSFVEMFESAGRELPWLTQAVIDASDFIRDYWYVVVGVLFIIPYGLMSYYRTPEGRKTMDVFLIDIPLFGPLVQKSSIARFSRTLSTLLSAGVRIIDSLDIAAATAGNYAIESNLEAAKSSISKGKTLAEPLRKSKYIPDMVAQMILVGEQTGNLDTMLSKIADFYEDEVETTAAALTTLIEPLMMVFLGGIVAVLVVAMYLPIFGMADTVGA